jgi:hypothetical protein
MGQMKQTNNAIHTVNTSYDLVLPQYTINDRWFIVSVAGSQSVVTLRRAVLAVLPHRHQRRMWAK